MKRALLAAALVALVTAAPAAAKPKPPLRATTSLSPPVALFANGVTARVSVIADTKRVDRARLRVTVNFAPYEPVGQPREIHTGSGRYVQTTWTWKLRCLTPVCAPVSPPSDVFHDFSFPPAQVRGFGVNGRPYRAHVFFPQLKVLSQVSPREQAFIEAHKHIKWLYQLTPAAGDAYRLPPGLVFWLAVALAGLCGAAALVLAGRWALGLRSPAAAAPALPASYLERALALFFWANARGDETLQRKALERVADELPLDVVDLSEIARELAWSPETPEGEEVEAISERAGVLVHPEEQNGA
jgi:hypothetical protein